MKGPLFAQTWRFLDALSGAGPTSDGEGISTSFEHSWAWPPWVTLLALILAAGLILLIYLREQGRAGRRRRILLAGMRVLLVAMVIFMMYGWTQQYHRTDLPDLVVVLDDSESMAVEDHYEPDAGVGQVSRRAADAGFSEPSRFNLARSLLLHTERGWLNRLAAHYRLKVFRVGPSLRAETGDADDLHDTIRRMGPTGVVSKLGQGLQDVLDAQRGRPTAAIIMLTDGVTTEGQTIGDLAERARRRAIPLYLVGLGSDQPPRDLRLSDLLVDDVVFVDEMVNFEVKLHGGGYAGESVIVRLTGRGHSETLAEKRVVLPEDAVPTAVRLAYRPQQEGDFEHVVEVVPMDDEVNRKNNRLTRRIRVRDATLRVLFVQSYPSYEFRYLRNLLSRVVRRGGEGNAIELTTILQEADLEHAQQDATAQGVFPVRRDDLFAYDVVIFGDVNPGFLSRTVMEHISDFVTERGGGIVFLAGPSFTPLAYRDTPLASLFPIDLSTAAVPHPDHLLAEPFVVEPTLMGLTSPFMQIGETPEETLPLWRQLPGLYWLLTAPDPRPAARVLAVHPSRSDATGKQLPVILMQFVGAGKVIFHASDESFFWSRFPGDPKYYERYWLQSLRYLSRSKLSSDQQSAKIETDQPQYQRGESVRLRVRFSDERRAPADDGGVSVMVQRSGGRKHQVSLHRDSLRRAIFEGTISGLPDGQYRAWLASSGEQATPRYFTIAAPPGEQARLAMDSGDLRRAAELSRGKYYTLRNADRLPRDLPRGRRVTVESLPPRPIWNSPPLAAMFVVLLTAEWVMRRRQEMV